MTQILVFHRVYTHSEPPTSSLTTHSTSTLGISMTGFFLFYFLLLSWVANSDDDLLQQFFRLRKMLPFMGLALHNVNVASQTSLARRHLERRRRDDGSYQP